MIRVALTALLLAASYAIGAENAATPAADPVLERATLRSLGAYWIIRGDENKNAAVRVDYRRQGDATWHEGPPLFRVARGANKTKEYGTLLKVPEDAWLFAGSVVMLEPNTGYELKLTLSDPDGGGASKTLISHTTAEPIAPKGRIINITAGASLAAANKNAKPGDILLLHAGNYDGSFKVNRSGEPGKPIVWRGAGDGEVIIDGQHNERCFDASGIHDVWFENLTIQNAKYGIVSHESSRIVVRRCHIHDVDFGITASKNGNDSINDYFICDNTIEGRSVWPRSKGIENARGIQITGSGHVVAYNRIRGFADAMDTMPSPRCEAIDFHNNDCSELTDDGCEMDYSQRNTRCFENRFTNVYQGISTQPVYGGPTYIFRNVLFNVCVEPFKMHNSPSGALMIHNTVVKKGMPLMVFTKAPMENCVFRNNLFIGTADAYAFQCQAPTNDCDFDYDGYGGGPFGNFLKWNNVKYPNLATVREKAPIEKHAVQVDSATVFASGAQPPADEKQQVQTPPDLRLSTNTSAIDAGEKLPGFDDGFSGSAPDLGAYEIGAALPQYGPRAK